MTRRFFVLAVAIGLLAGTGSARAQVPSAALQEARQQARIDVAGPDQSGADGPMRRIGYTLSLLHRVHAASLSRAARRSVEVGLPIRGSSVAITALALPEQVDALRADLNALGLEGGATAGRLVSGRLPIASLRDMARLPTLHSAQPALSVTRVGATTSQGVAAMNTDVLRDRLSTRGGGAQVGVLSDTFDNFEGIARGAGSDVRSGDLPGPANPNGFTEPVQVLQEGSTAGSDEGRALLQIVHDVAPAARLSFHNATEGIATFVNGIQALADAGASVIADDVLFLAEPMFQDGLIAQAVDRVAFEQDVLYFSSAGNTGPNGYRSAFRASSTTGPAGGEAHDFDPGPGFDGTQTLTLSAPSSPDLPPATLTLALHWDQPAASAGGPGATSDLEIAILDKEGNVLALEQQANIGGNPFAFARLVNDGTIDADGDGEPDTTFQVSIERLAGPRPSRLAYVAFTRDGRVRFQEWATDSPTLYGHPNARGAIAVGAAAFFNTPAFDTAPPKVNNFSALGGSPILFDARGQRLPTPERRPKPEITAPDGVNTTFFGQNFEDGDAFPNFFGTSAAVAHAAGVAALARSARPSQTAEAIADALIDSAIDIRQASNDEPTGAGFDAFSGAGLIDAAAVMVQPPVVERFTAVPTEANAGIVRWAEATADVDTYTLERSFFGQPFQTVATVGGGQGTYDVPVRDLAVGTHVFRLRWTRADGTTEEGPRRSLLIPTTERVSLGDPYPNPTTGAVRVEVTVREEQAVLFALYDALGRLQGIISSRIIRPNRPQIVEVRADQVRRLASGLYFVRAIGNRFDTAVPFQVVR